MGAKGLCIPFDQPEKIGENQACVHPKLQRQSEILHFIWSQLLKEKIMSFSCSLLLKTVVF